MEVENCFGKPDDQGFHIKKPTKILTNDNQLRAQDRAFPIAHDLSYLNGLNRRN